MGLIKLIKLQLRVNFGLSALRWYYENDLKKFLSAIGLAAIALISLGTMFLLYLIILQGIYIVTAELGQPEVILAFGLMISSMLVLFFGLTLVMSVFFFSRDLPLLVSLPLQPGAILGSKFTVIIIYEYLTILPFLLPAICVFGVGGSMNLLYWITALIIFLMTPVLPLAIASLFILGLMSLTNMSKRGDALRIIGMAIFLMLIFLINYILAGIPAGDEFAYFESVLQQSEGLITMMTRLYPPALFAIRALSSSGLKALVNLGYYLGTNLIGVGLVLLIGQKLFYRGLIGSSEVSVGKRLPDHKLAKKIASVSTPGQAIAAREIKYLLRTPVYLFNSLAILIIAPVFLIIPLIGGGTISAFVETIRVEVPILLQIIFLVFFIAVMALFAPAASSSFSREGRQFWISQVIPVSTFRQINGKLLYSYLVTALSIPVVLLVNQFFLSLGITDLLLVVAMGLLVSFPAITINLLIDLARPYLNWDNPHNAIKQNMNVLFGMLAGGIVYGLILLAGWVAYLVRGTDLAVYMALAITAVLSGTLFYLLLQHIAPRRYRDIEI